MRNKALLILLILLQFSIGNLAAQSFTYYYEQTGATLAKDTAAVAYNITAIAQTDSNGYGPGYFIQGLTNKGYLYQEGITYNWFGLGGFNFVYNVFSPSGMRIAGLSKYIGTINSGDKVLLFTYFGDGKVYMFLDDYYTNTQYLANFSSEGATRFIGSPSSISNTNHFFTGLMTAWPHITPISPFQTVTYTPVVNTNSSARLWAYTLKDVLQGSYQYLYKTFNFSSAPVSYAGQSIFRAINQSLGYYRGVFSTGFVQPIPLTLLKSNNSNILVDSGQSCILKDNVTVDGGQYPYVYYTYFDNQTVSFDNTSSTSVVLETNCGGILPGNHYYYVKVVDLSGSTVVTPNRYIKVNPAPQLTYYSVIPGNSFFYNNDTISVSASISGGTPPYLYNWYANNNLILSTTATASTINMKSNGNNQLTLIAKDSAGSNLTRSAFFYTDYNYLHIWFVILVLLILLLIFLINRYLYNRDEYYYVSDHEKEESDPNSPHIEGETQVTQTTTEATEISSSEDSSLKDSEGSDELLSGQPDNPSYEKDGNPSESVEEREDRIKQNYDSNQGADEDIKENEEERHEEGAKTKDEALESKDAPEKNSPNDTLDKIINEGKGHPIDDSHMTYSYGQKDEADHEQEKESVNLDSGKSSEEKAERIDSDSGVGEQEDSSVSVVQVPTLSEGSEDSEIGAEMADSNSMQNAETKISSSNQKRRKKSSRKTFTTKRKRPTSTEAEA
ncbi:MAG: hypothetical protein KGH71_00610 [Candidatus Micrarchaeota archaeon]|nr:hypothetical protein [Candidatus Micrarchaeota archaeon]